MYRDMVNYHYVSRMHLYGYSVKGHPSFRVRVSVQYYLIFRNRYVKYWPITGGKFSNRTEHADLDT